jgi:hypothetical protein
MEHSPEGFQQQRLTGKTEETYKFGCLELGHMPCAGAAQVLNGKFSNHL